MQALAAGGSSELSLAVPQPAGHQSLLAILRASRPQQPQEPCGCYGKDHRPAEANGSMEVGISHKCQVPNFTPLLEMPATNTILWFLFQTDHIHSSSVCTGTHVELKRTTCRSWFSFHHMAPRTDSGHGLRGKPLPPAIM